MRQRKHMAGMHALQLIHSPAFYLCIAGVGVIYGISVYPEMDKYSDLSYLLELFIGLSMPKKLVVLVAAIPFAASFCSDWNGQYIRAVVGRSGVRRYTVSKITGCFCATFSISFLGIMLANVVLSFSLPMFLNTEDAMPVYEPFASLAQGPLPVLYLCALAAVFSMAMATWSIVGMAFSAFIPDHFIAVTAAIVASYVLEELTTLLPPFLDLYLITRSVDILGQGAAVSFFYFTLVFLAYSAVAGLIFHFRVRRRMRNEVV